MKRLSSLSLLFVAAAVLGCAAAAPSANAAPSGDTSPERARSAAQALYTAQQAERGSARYEAICLECHTKVEFTERPFLFAWEGSSVGQLYAYISENMPEDGPGSLPQSDYLALMAYVLQMNGYPAGDAELTADMERMRAVPFAAQGGETD
jgi:hypothetical protein